MLDAGLNANVIQVMGPSRMASVLLARGTSRGTAVPPEADPLALGESFRSNPGTAPLHFTANGNDDNHAAAAEVLLKAGANPDARMTDGQTPLHVCATTNALKVAKVLLSFACDLNPVQRERTTPLFVAISSQHTHMVKLLLNAGADVNATDRNGLPGLITAIFKESMDIIVLLLQSGCKVDGCIYTRLSPFRAALITQNIRVLEMMIEAGCKLPARNEQGMYVDETNVLCDASLEELMKKMSAEQQAWLHEKLHNPSSLLMLSRKTVRDSLGSNLLRKVEELRLPTVVKEFIVMKELSAELLLLDP